MTARSGAPSPVPLLPVPPQPAPVGVTLAPMDRTHLSVTARLEQELFGPQAWSEATLREELADPTRHYVVTLDGSGTVTGYAGLARYDDEAHVMTVGVVPAWRRRGVAAAMVRDLLAAAGGRRVILEVAADNTGAQRLYEGHGFAVIGQRRHYYGPGEHAVVMAREPSAEGPRG